MSKSNLPLYLIKLGGSLITDKTKLNSFRPKAAKDFFAKLAEFYNSQKHRLLIGNGAGANTHYLAKKYHTMQGSCTDSDWLGSCLVKESALRHHSWLNQLGLEANLPLFSFSASSMFFSQKGSRVKKPNFSSLLYGLKKGLVPHLYGDVILDKKTGTTIYSTEKLFLELLPVLQKQYSQIYIFLLGDTAGVLDNKKQTIVKISSRNFADKLSFLRESRGFDVTGGMLAKVQFALKMAEHGCQVYIGSGLNFQTTFLTAPQKQKNLTQVVA